MTTLLPQIDFNVIAPQTILSGIAILVMLLGLVIDRKSQIILALISIVGLFICMAFFTFLPDENRYTFSHMAVVDGISFVFNLLFMLSTALIITVSIPFIDRTRIHPGEYYSLIIFATIGMILMATTMDLIILFLGLELMSISLYILATITRHDIRSNEAAMKYLLLGAFATGFLLYGIAFIYGATGTTDLVKIMARFQERPPVQNEWMMPVGIGLILVGLGFKIGLVPFHFWIPDVYEGAPTIITAFMSIGPKAAGFAALIRVLLSGPFTPIPEARGVDWPILLAGLAGLTMTVGNLIAIAQGNIKRMLAYSSIAHAGYIMVGLITANIFSIKSILFYLFAYLFMNLGAFTIVYLMENRDGDGTNLKNYTGLGFKSPLLALAMTFFMLSLAGFPPTAGFMGKFYIFRDAINAGFIGLVIVAVLNSVVSAYYYLRVVVYMYMREPDKESTVPFIPNLISLILIICVLAIFYLGIFPNRLLDITRLALYF